MKKNQKQLKEKLMWIVNKSEKEFLIKHLKKAVLH